MYYISSFPRSGSFFSNFILILSVCVETYESGFYPTVIMTTVVEETLYRPNIDCFLTFNTESESETVLDFSRLIIDSTDRCAGDAMAVSCIVFKRIAKKLPSRHTFLNFTSLNFTSL